MWDSFVKVIDKKRKNMRRGIGKIEAYIHSTAPLILHLESNAG